MSKRMSYAFAVLVLLIAATLRIWAFTSLPIGISDIELTQINLMQDAVEQGEIRAFYELNGQGQEGLFAITLTIAKTIFGEGSLGLRLPALFSNIISIALMYTLGVRLYGRVAGLAAAALLSIIMWATLLSRLIVVEAVLPMLVTAVLLALARAMPVYARSRAETTNTQDFAALGILLGLSLYVHPSGLMLVLGTMIFIAYIVVLRRPLSLRWLSYIGFSILMLLIVAMPYMISTIRLPDLNAGGRLFGNFGSVTISSLQSLVGVTITGDMSVITNVQGRPLIDVMSGFFVVVGIIIALRNWREPRYSLTIILGIFLAAPAFLATNAPNFLAMSVILPVIALFFGLGVSVILASLPQNTRVLGIIATTTLIVTNVGWTGFSLFTQWGNQEATQLAYRSELGRIAQHIDVTANDLPTVLCYNNWANPRQAGEDRSAANIVLLLMNNDNTAMRYVDCRSGFLFINGGEAQQVVIPSSDILLETPPDIADWLALGTPINTLPERSVIVMDVEDILADTLGVYTTTTPASYVTEDDISERIPIPPPIRFAGNLTWLGYESDPVPVYETGNRVPVTNYWRVEGLVPRDLRLFTHILLDPVTIAANVDTIHADPTQLRERDVYIHTVSIPLDETLPSSLYEISVGAYQETDNARLDVFASENVVRGNRIFIYEIQVFRNN